MLVPLFGNPNIQRILLYLFVNEKCYGAQLQSSLRVPLTPIQKGLKRLEKGGIIESSFEGKFKIYQLNPSYPLKEELESLLKKAYLRLPSEEKKRYCSIYRSKKIQVAPNNLLKFWKRLEKTKHLKFSTRSKKGNEKTIQTGIADVEATSPSLNTLVFQEKGVWVIDELPKSCFSNQFRWQLQTAENLISLEHLRYGQNQPVFLFHLALSGTNTLESVSAHLCGEDTYSGHIHWNQKAIHFHMRVIGHDKNDELFYQYL